MPLFFISFLSRCSCLTAFKCRCSLPPTATRSCPARVFSMLGSVICPRIVLIWIIIRGPVNVWEVNFAPVEVRLTKSVRKIHIGIEPLQLSFEILAVSSIISPGVLRSNDSRCAFDPTGMMEAAASLLIALGPWQGWQNHSRQSRIRKSTRTNRIVLAQCVPRRLPESR